MTLECSQKHILLLMTKLLAYSYILTNLNQLICCRRLGLIDLGRLIFCWSAFTVADTSLEPGLSLNSFHVLFRSVLPQNVMSFKGAYVMFFTAVGITQ